MNMLNKIRIAFALSLLAVAAVSAVDSASAGSRYGDSSLILYPTDSNEFGP
jgi:hypothetical protein